MIGDNAEHAARDGHYKRSRNTLPTDVTNAEKQFLVADVEVVQVATHFLGRFHGGIDAHVVAVGVGWEYFRHHAHLYAVGDMQLAGDAFFFSICFLQPLEAAPHPVDDEGEQRKSQYHQCQQFQPHLVQAAIDFLVGTNHRH